MRMGGCVDGVNVRRTVRMWKRCADNVQQIAGKMNLGRADH
jgi:hypothetical protein